MDLVCVCARYHSLIASDLFQPIIEAGKDKINIPVRGTLLAEGSKHHHKERLLTELYEAQHCSENLIQCSRYSH